MLKPVTMTVIILVVIWIWNDYLLPSLVLTSKANRTIPLSTAASSDSLQFSGIWQMAGLTLTIIPVITSISVHRNILLRVWLPRRKIINEWSAECPAH